MTTETGFDAHAWLARWEAQQAGHVPDREQVFDLMLDVLEGLCAEDPGGPPRRVLDLGCGPGSLAARVAARFGDAEVVAVDADPVMLELGRQAVGERVRWVRADLAAPGWVERVGDAGSDAGFDAAVSATALHWLPADALAGFAAEVHGLLRPGGVFLDFDTLRTDDDAVPRLGPLLTRLRSERTEQRTSRPGFEDFYAWWEAARREPAFAAPLVERDAGDHGARGGSTLGQWERALRAAGFDEVATVTQLLDRRLLAALR